MLKNKIEKNKTEEFYPTPAICTLALLAHEKFNGIVGEPAAGMGDVSKLLELNPNSKVISTDLIDRGYCPGGVDYLTTQMEFNHVVTNPPFSLGEEFVRKALKETTGKVALFLRLAFLEAQCRYDLFTKTPLKTVYVFCGRPSLYPAGDTRKTGGKVAYAWFIWENGYTGEPAIKWLSADMNDWPKSELFDTIMEQYKCQN